MTKYEVHNRLRAGASEPLPFDRFLYSGIVVLMLLSGGILSLAYVLTSQREQNGEREVIALHEAY